MQQISGNHYRINRGSIVKNLFVLLFVTGSIYSFLFSSAALAAEKDPLVTTVERIADKLEARVGFSAYDLESGRRWEYQGDQRFPIASTFKTLACAALLHKVDAGEEQLDRSVSFTASDLVNYSPITEKYADLQAMTLSELCEATLTTSDNTAANLVLQALGGPEEVTKFARLMGDEVTRLDRWEIELNEALPGDLRDTTTPNAMVGNFQELLLGDVLSPGSRDQLRDWLERNQVAEDLFRAVVPATWTVADRTGAGGFGSRSITAIMWTEDRKPVIVAVYITQTEASLPASNAAIAEIGAAIVAAVDSN